MVGHTTQSSGGFDETISHEGLEELVDIPSQRIRAHGVLVQQDRQNLFVAMAGFEQLPYAGAKLIQPEIVTGTEMQDHRLFGECAHHGFGNGFDC